MQLGTKNKVQKAIFYDVDGTLAPPFKAPPLRFKHFLWGLSQAKIPQILCSGKNAEYLAGLARGLGLVNFPGVIAENGGVLFNWRKLKKEYLVPLSEIEAIRQWRAKIEKSYKRLIIYEEPKETTVTFFFKHDPLLFRELSLLEDKSRKIKFLLHRDGGFDILRVGTSKREAIRRFLDKFGLSEEKVITCGDGENDLEMFEIGLPITFREAPFVVKKKVRERKGFVSSLSAPWGIVEVFSLLRDKGIIDLPFSACAFRPWGKWEVLDERKGFKVKYLEVKPGHRLSLQRHFHRSEIWVVVQGKALIVKGKDQLIIKEGDTIAIEKQQWHRIENIGSGLLRIVEVQKGSYLGEDDIERAQDDYGRLGDLNS